MPAAEPRRNLAIPGTHNFRDLGGYGTSSGGRIRWRTLFRADSLHRLTPAGRSLLLGDYRLRTVIDLRSREEARVEPNALADAPGVNYIHLPYPGASGGAGRPRDLEGLYRGFLDHGRRWIAAVVTALATPHALPAVVHCTAGKDRTGVVAAVLLSVLGVSDDEIVQDYALSSILPEDRLTEIRRRAAEAGYDLQWYDLLLACRPEAMAATLRYLNRRYGGAADYLRSAGVAEQTLVDLQQALVEPVSPRLDGGISRETGVL